MAAAGLSARDVKALGTLYDSKRTLEHCQLVAEVGGGRERTLPCRSPAEESRR